MPCEKGPEKDGDKSAFDWDGFPELVEGVLRKLSEQHPPCKKSTTAWNEVVETFQCAGYDFSLTRHWISRISSECGTEKDSNVDTVSSKRTEKKKRKKKKNAKGDSHQTQQKELVKMPEAWLDMTDKSNMFPKFRFHVHRFHRHYGLKDFIVLERNINTEKGNKAIDCDMAKKLLSSLSSAALKCEWEVPLFVDYGLEWESHFLGSLDFSGFRTSFEAEYRWSISNCIWSETSDLFKIFNWKSRLPKSTVDQPSKVFVKFIYEINEPSVYFRTKLPSELAFSPTDFGFDNYFLMVNDGHPINQFHLNASWSEVLLESKLNNRELKSLKMRDLDPLDAPEWSVRAKVADTSEVPLGECLKRFLNLSSTQTESLLSNPQIPSMLKYRRIYNQREEVNASLAMQGLTEPKVRKVTSKLTLKPEESLIPVESLNVILDFLFCDAKLHPSQPSNGGNTSTTTTVEDEVEDKFYLSYKELSKYFKSAQLSSLTSRLAICMCIVNKYHGGLGAVNQLWGEFVLEMKYHWENNCEIKGLEPVEPTLDYPELLQKLQMLNSCIIKKEKAKDASPPITDNSTAVESNTDISSEEFIDISELPLDEESVGQSGARVDTSTIGTLRRVQILIEHLLSDKQAFKAMNPGCVLGDFARWCSIDNWKENEGVKTTNEGLLNQRIKISDDLSLVFHKSAQRRRSFPDDDDYDDDDAQKVFHWLASVKPSDLVFRLMPTLIYSTVTTLLKHPEWQFHFLKKQLKQIRNQLEEQFHNETPQCNSSDAIKKLEDHIYHVTFIEQKMASAQYLLKKFRHFDPSESVSDSELKEFVSNLIEFTEAPIKTSDKELPSNTHLGKLIHKIFIDGYKLRGETGNGFAKETIPEAAQDQVYKLHRPMKIEFLAIVKTTGSCLQRFHCTIFPDELQMASAFTSEQHHD